MIIGALAQVINKQMPEYWKTTVANASTSDNIAAIMVDRITLGQVEARADQPYFLLV